MRNRKRGRRIGNKRVRRGKISKGYNRLRNEGGGEGTIGIGVEACTKDGSKEVVRSKEVGEGVEAELKEKLEGMGLTESEEGVEDDWGNQREKVVEKGMVGLVEKEG